MHTCTNAAVWLLRDDLLAITRDSITELSGIANTRYFCSQKYTGRNAHDISSDAELGASAD